MGFLLEAMLLIWNLVIKDISFGINALKFILHKMP